MDRTRVYDSHLDSDISDDERYCGSDLGCVTDNGDALLGQLWFGDTVIHTSFDQCLSLDPFVLQNEFDVVVVGILGSTWSLQTRIPRYRLCGLDPVVVEREGFT